VAASEALRAVIAGHRAERALTLVDLTSDNLDTHDYPLDIRPDVVLVSPIGETVAVLDRVSDELQVHALRRKEVLVSVEDVHTDVDITFNPDGSIVYWVDATSGTLNSVDLWSDRKSLRLAREGAKLSAMSRSVDGTLGFISNADNGTVLIVNLRSFRLLRTSQVGGRPERAWGTADGQFMLVPNAGDGTVTAISTITTESLYTVDAVANPVSINPGWIDTVAAIVGADGTVLFINIADGRVLDRARVDAKPEEGIVTSDSKTLAIPVPGTGSLVFFDMQKRATLSTIGSLPGDIGAAALAISNNLCH
jgi:hypothetical protein